MSPTKRTVLIGIDGSVFSEDAFEWFADHFSRPETDRIILHHTLSPAAPVSGGILKGVPSSLDKDYSVQLKKLKSQADLLQSKFMDKCGQRGFDCSWHTHIGSAGPDLVQVAEEEQAQLAVLGTRRLNVVRRTLLGSVSTFVLHHLHIPVLVVPSFSS